MERINVTRSSMPPLAEYINEIKDVWDNVILTNEGPKYQQLAQAMQKRMGASFVALFCNGHQALEAIFSKFSPGSEVITTPFTFASTTLAIVRCGLVPVFCDIEPIYYTIDADKIENLITEKTVAIAGVHVYGNLCDWRRIKDIADKHKLTVIYDAAHAFGVRDGEIDVGNLGDMAMFSFHATKVFHTIEGGGVVCHSDADYERLNAWKRFGVCSGQQSPEIVGTNAKMTEFAAAMGLCNLRHLEEQVGLRKIAAQQYHRYLSNQKGLILCPKQNDVTSNYAYMPVRIVPECFGSSRDQVASRLDEQGIIARKYFYPLTSDFPIVQNCRGRETLSVAREVSNQILCLPLYADLKEAEVEKICDIVLK